MAESVLSALVQNPLLLVAGAAMLLVALIGPLIGSRSGRRGRVNVTDPKVQLASVKRVGFRARPLLNKSERGSSKPSPPRLPARIRTCG